MRHYLGEFPVKLDPKSYKVQRIEGLTREIAHFRRERGNFNKPAELCTQSYHIT